MRYKESVVIVTGAGRGIGKAIALRFAEEGAKLVLVSRTESELQAVRDEIQSKGGTALTIPTDVTNHQAVTAMKQQVEAAWGTIDVLVNNAASFYAVGPIWEVDPEQWWRDVAINLLGVYLCCREIVPGMIDRHKGHIINLIGGGTGNPFPYGSAYGSSKAAVMRLTESLAIEVKDSGVIVFAMGPGLVRTALTEFQVQSEAGQKWLPRIGTLFKEGMHVPPTRAAELAIKLASGAFDALTGRAFSVSDDMDEIHTQIPDILKNDRYTLRMTG